MRIVDGDDVRTTCEINRQKAFFFTAFSRNNNKSAWEEESKDGVMDWICENGAPPIETQANLTRIPHPINLPWLYSLCSTSSLVFLRKFSSCIIADHKLFCCFSSWRGWVTSQAMMTKRDYHSNWIKSIIVTSEEVGEETAECVIESPSPRKSCLNWLEWVMRGGHKFRFP